MKRLTLFAMVIGLAAPSAGCIISGGGGGDGDGQLDVSWSLGGGCPEGATTVQVVSELDGTDDCMQAPPGPMCIEHLYDCAETGQELSDPVPLGLYSVWINLTDDTREVRYASSFAESANLEFDGDIAAVDFAFPTDSGFFDLTWTLIDEASEQPITCTDAGAEQVGIAATLFDSTTLVNEEWACDAGEGSMSAPIGGYTVVVQILDTDEEPPLALGTSEAGEKEIKYGNEVVNLGNFEFAFQ